MSGATQIKIFSLFFSLCILLCLQPAFALDLECSLTRHEKSAEYSSCRFISFDSVKDGFSAVTVDGKKINFLAERNGRIIVKSVKKATPETASDNLSPESTFEKTLTGFSCSAEEKGTVCLPADDFTALHVDNDFIVETLVELARGDKHACARTSRGKVFCWGSNDRGQLGSGVYQRDSKTPLRVNLPSTITSIRAKGDTSCALSSSGEIFCWGKLPDNSYQSFANVVHPHRHSSGSYVRIKSFEIADTGILAWNRDGTLTYQDFSFVPASPAVLPQEVNTSTASFCGSGGKTYFLTGAGILRGFGKPFDKNYSAAGNEIWNVSWIPQKQYSDLTMTAAGCDIRQICMTTSDYNFLCQKSGYNSTPADAQKLSFSEYLKKTEQKIVELKPRENRICLETDRHSLFCTALKDRATGLFIHIDIALEKLIDYSFNNDGVYGITESGDLLQWLYSETGDEDVAPKTSKPMKTAAVFTEPLQLECMDESCCVLERSGAVSCFDSNQPAAPELLEGVSATEIFVSDHFYFVSNRGKILVHSHGEKSKVVPTSTVFRNFIPFYSVAAGVCAAPETGGVRCYSSNYAGEYKELGEAKLFPSIEIIALSGRPGIYLSALTGNGTIINRYSGKDLLMTATGAPIGKVHEVSGINGTITEISHGDFHSCVRTSDSEYCFPHYKTAATDPLKAFLAVPPDEEYRASLKKDFERGCPESLLDTPECYSEFVLPYKKIIPVADQILTARNDHETCTLKDLGSVICLDHQKMETYRPLDKVLHAPIRQLSAADRHFCALTDIHSVYCWGQGVSSLYSESTYGSTLRTAVEVIPPQKFNLTGLSSGGTVSCALSDPNILLCWGGALPGTVYE